jgi:hypothetical protein
MLTHFLPSKLFTTYSYAKTKTLTELIQEALFADDCALMAHRPDALQVMLNKFSESSKLFGLTISLAKTEVLFQPAPENNTSPPPSASMARNSSSWTPSST